MFNFFKKKPKPMPIELQPLELENGAVFIPNGAWQVHKKIHLGNTLYPGCWYCSNVPLIPTPKFHVKHPAGFENRQAVWKRLAGHEDKLEMMKEKAAWWREFWKRKEKWVKQNSSEN